MKLKYFSQTVLTRRCSRAGFTLPELMISVSIGVLIAGTAATMVTSITSSWSTTSAMAIMDGEATIANEILRTELRGANVIGIETVNDFDAIHYLKSDSFNNTEGRPAFNQERRIIVTPPVNGARSLVITAGNGAILRTLVNHIENFDVIDWMDDPDLLRVGELQATLQFGLTSSSQQMTTTTRLWLRNSGSLPLVIEAESSTPMAPMVVATDPAASGDSYVWAPDGVGSNHTAPGGPGFVSHTVAFPRDDNYYFWARVIAPDGSHDSFFVYVDSTPIVNPWHVPNSSNWRWRYIGEMPLSEGDHDVIFLQRDHGTKLDRFLVADDATFVPTF